MRARWGRSGPAKPTYRGPAQDLSRALHGLLPCDRAHPIEYLWKKTKKRATHNQYFKEFALLAGAVEQALAYFATHPETVLGLLGRYCEESGLELAQAA